MSPDTELAVHIHREVMTLVRDHVATKKTLPSDVDLRAMADLVWQAWAEAQNAAGRLLASKQRAEEEANKARCL